MSKIAGYKGLFLYNTFVYFFKFI